MAAHTSPQRDKRGPATKKPVQTRRKNATAAEAEPKEEPKESQQKPEQDSGLQTPQPDQPMPTEDERQEQESNQDDAPSPKQTEPSQDKESESSGRETFRADVRVADQVAQEERRQAELAEAREVHNQRTAGNLDVLTEA